MSASIMPAKGAGPMPAISTMFTPVSGPMRVRPPIARRRSLKARRRSRAAPRFLSRQAAALVFLAAAAGARIVAADAAQRIDVRRLVDDTRLARARTPPPSRRRRRRTRTRASRSTSQMGPRRPLRSRQAGGIVARQFHLLVEVIEAELDWVDQPSACRRRDFGPHVVVAEIGGGCRPGSATDTICRAASSRAAAARDRRASLRR